ncbi:MAG: winged helix-turn-helix domain-containing protein [Nitrososphaerales archaeon]|jgi:predicted transcriptional regulator
MSRQSRVEALVGVLLATREGATKMRVMYEQGITASQATECLSFLRISGFVKREEGTNVFRPTEKGISLLEDYERLSEEIGWRITA